MDVYHTLNELPEDARKAVAAIGNFDAVHRGHQDLIAQAKREAAQRKTKLAVMTFEPHPRRIFRPDDQPFRVTPLSLKLDRLKQLGVDIVYVVNFDWEFAGQSALDFINTLKNQINPAAIVVGMDFHFGHNRSGSVELMRDQGLEVVAANLTADSRHGIISATRIRGLIQSGHIDEANQLLGWSWEIRGIVQHGDKRGRELGYPTANVPLGETIHPAYGVYACWVQVPGHADWYRAATNIGIRPMFETKTALVEAHILDFKGDLYGRELRIRPVKKIRDEMKFGALDALTEQIEKDCAETRTILTGI